MNADRLLALYARIADAPDAVARLRRFILDLAVRGKLVPQDPADEPASELLKRIGQRVQPDQNRRINRRSQVGSGLERLPYNLPDGWSAPSLSEIVRVVNGRAYKQQELLAKGTPVLRVGNLFTSSKWYYSDLDLDSDKYCDSGDLIYAWSASFGPFIWNGPRVIYHYHIWKLQLLSEGDVSKQYIYFYLLQKTREIKEEGRGVSMVHMTKAKMEKLVIPLPPLAEQHRIVAKVDELMGLCDRLEEARTRREADRERLTTASLSRLIAPDTDAETFQSHARFALEALPALTSRPDQIKALRQTIVNLAVRGKLVESDAADEPAVELLKKTGVEGGTASPTGRRQPPESPFDLPRHWAWTELRELVSHSDAGWSPRTENHERQGDAWGVLKVSAVSWERFDASANKQLLPGTKPRLQAQVRKGDFLISRANTSELVAKAVIVEEDPVHLMMSDKIVRLHIVKGCSRHFVLMVNNAADFARAYYAANATGVSPSMKNVSRDVILKLPIPLPPLAEQHRIVAKVDQLMALCDQLEAALTTADTTRRRLLEALLHEALAPAADGLAAAQ